MFLKYKDYNGASTVLAKTFDSEWQEINSVLSTMPLYLKDSDQDTKQGQPIFDPVANNIFIKEELIKSKWTQNASIPNKFRMWGKDVDFSKLGVLLEVQFSNYPFLLNNLIRSELFFREKISFTQQHEVKAVILITKMGILPSSNSTLYYEQATEQIDSLYSHNIFKVPLRIVGIGINDGQTISTITSKYKARYSRDPLTTVRGSCTLCKTTKTLSFN